MLCSYVLQDEFSYPIPTVTELDASDNKLTTLNSTNLQAVHSH